MTATAAARVAELDAAATTLIPHANKHIVVRVKAHAHVGAGAHVANAAYATAPEAAGKGVGRAMGEHSLAQAKGAGFTAMQFNFVVSTYRSAVHLWQAIGFEVVGRLPGAFRRPCGTEVDALVMYRKL